MNEPTLRLDSIEKRFGAVHAVAGVSLDITGGEFFSLLGPSGSGKTTMLRIIAGLETPDAGRVLIKGRDVTLLPPYERGIGMVFQDFLLFPHKTVAENIAFPLRMQRKPAREQREHLDWVVRLVHLEGLEGRYPSQLSGGQKQRVALARGLVSRPTLLLLDEPLANLDRELRKEMEIEVRRYQIELGIPFIYVTHNQEEALTMSDRIAVMNRGRLDQVGAKLEVYANPATRFVASFVGFSNRIDGRIVEVADGGAVLDADGLRLLTPRPAGARPGAAAACFLKSERIQIAAGAPSGAGSNDRNQVGGTLADVIFKGQYVDFIVRLSGGRQLIASGSPELAGMTKDQPVTLSWPVQAGDTFLAED